MKGIVCSNLYAITEQRNLTSNTLAVRELVDGAIKEGLEIEAVLRFEPLVRGQGVFWPRKRVLNGLPVYDIPTVGFRFIYSALLTRLILFLLGFRGRYDFAICHQSFNFIAAQRVLRERVKQKYFVVHGSDLGKPQLRECLRTADKIFARSHALARQLQENYATTPRGVVYSGIDAAEIIDLEAKDLSLDQGLVIAMACLMLPRKNVSPCLQAFESLINKGVALTVHLYGDGPLKVEIEKEVEHRGLGGTVRIHGFRPREEVLEAMRRSHLFLMPSFGETFGLAYLEAMASGCVIIGHQGWGIDGVVEDSQNGYLVSSATAQEIEAKIMDYSGLSDRLQLHKVSIDTVSAYSKSSAIHNFYQLLRPERL